MAYQRAIYIKQSSLQLLFVFLTKRLLKTTWNHLSNDQRNHDQVNIDQKKKEMF